MFETLKAKYLGLALKKRIALTVFAVLIVVAIVHAIVT